MINRRAGLHIQIQPLKEKKKSRKSGETAVAQYVQETEENQVAWQASKEGCLETRDMK